MVRDRPSGPVTPRASTILWVSRKGTRSGVSNVFPYAALRIVVSLRSIVAYLLEETIKVDVYGVPAVRIHEYVFKVAIAKAVV